MDTLCGWHKYLKNRMDCIEDMTSVRLCMPKIKTDCLDGLRTAGFITKKHMSYEEEWAKATQTTTSATLATLTTLTTLATLATQTTLNNTKRN